MLETELRGGLRWHAPRDSDHGVLFSFDDVTVTRDRRDPGILKLFARSHISSIGALSCSHALWQLSMIQKHGKPQVVAMIGVNGSNMLTSYPDVTGLRFLGKFASPVSQFVVVTAGCAVMESLSRILGSFANTHVFSTLDRFNQWKSQQSVSSSLACLERRPSKVGFERLRRALCERGLLDDSDTSSGPASSDFSKDLFPDLYTSLDCFPKRVSMIPSVGSPQSPNSGCRGRELEGIDEAAELTLEMQSFPESSDG